MLKMFEPKNNIPHVPMHPVILTSVTDEAIETIQHGALNIIIAALGPRPSQFQALPRWRVLQRLQSVS